jgi:PEP-CTERM motif
MTFDPNPSFLEVNLMKSLSTPLFALATALAITPAAAAETITVDFSFTSSGGSTSIDGTGSYTVTVSPLTGAITEITGTISDPNFAGGAITNATITGLAEPSGSMGFVAYHNAVDFNYSENVHTSGAEIYKPFGEAVGGLFFDISGGGAGANDVVLLSDGGVNIFQPGGGTMDVNGGTTDTDPEGDQGDLRAISSFTLSTPEPSSLLLLGTGLLGGAFLLFRRNRSARSGIIA